MALIDDLHKRFCDYIDNGGMSGLRHMLAKPAFFFDKPLAEPKGYVDDLGSAPFDQCFIVYAARNGVSGLDYNVILIDRGTVAALIALPGDTFFTPSITGRLGDPSSFRAAIPRMNGFVSDTLMETLPEIRHCLAAISRGDRETVESDPLRKLNRKRSFKGKRKLAPFITIRDKVIEASPPQGGTHASPVGHERRGHYRTYKRSGKRVWINEMSINGGGMGRPRDYRVGQ